MNIKQIITKEVKSVLEERESPEAVLDLLSQIPENEAEALAQKLLAAVDDSLPEWIAQQAQGEQVSEGIGSWLAGGLAKGLKIIPGGQDLGAMYLASLDRKVPATLRIAFLIAITNLISPVDLGTLTGLDFLGPLAVLDDIVLLRRVLKKYQKAGLPAERHYDRIDQLAAAADEEPQAVDVEEEEEVVVERKMKLSRLYNIIKEELEVVLTNEEAEEMFDLDMSALLDEMMNEEEDKSFSKAAKEIEKKGTEGVFTAKADKAGMGVQAYAAKVLKKGSKASTKTKRQAAFAKGAATVARENK